MEAHHKESSKRSKHKAPQKLLFRLQDAGKEYKITKGGKKCFKIYDSRPGKKSNLLKQNQDFVVY